MTRAARTSSLSLLPYVFDPLPAQTCSILSRSTADCRIQKAKAKAPPKKAAAPKKTTQTTLTGKKTGKAATSKKRAKADSEDELSEGNNMSDDDAMLSHTPPKKAKTATAAKRAGSKPLGDVENESFTGEGAEGTSKEIDASEKFQRVSGHRNCRVALRLTSSA